jgi:hypothetical protein
MSGFLCRRALVPVVIAVFGCIATAARAEVEFPRIEGAISIEVQNDGDYESGPRNESRNNLFTLTEPQATLHLAKGLSIFVHGVLEPVTTPEADESRFFGNQGLFLEDLYVTYSYSFGGEGGEANELAIKGGKFTPRFGIAWDVAPGIYGTDFAELGYEFAERIGVEGALAVGAGGWGRHRLSASSFFLDTSPLSESVITGRQTTRLGDGGVGNTESFSSFVLTLEGEGLAIAPALRYHLSHIHQKRGTGDEINEKGFAVALAHTAPLSHGVEFRPLIEYVDFDGADGLKGRDRDYLTLAGEFTWRDWNAAISCTSRDTKSAAGSVDDKLVQISAGYAFDSGLAVDIAWRRFEEADADTEGVGIRLAHTLEF